ncbi:MAG TPA: MaoC/PaaZ C-terminal domain-containing protein [Candidatus Omnitrophota bacterium]|nr:MaoC/PaaZ C-terminal domain-containing protein [Candidatus Omnitrophota bacterium]HRZ15296.1 MaoC/PaaZ C-terminal domain-containing protein [Candidatus Omnitrophota bacterium]
MRSYLFEDLSVGMSGTFEVTVTQKAMDSFTTVCGDVNPLHTCAEYAQRCGYKAQVVYGFLTASFLSTLVGVYLPGEHSLLQSAKIEFARPVFVGDKLTVSGEITHCNEALRCVEIKARILNGRKECVCRAVLQVGLRDPEKRAVHG